MERMGHARFPAAAPATPAAPTQAPVTSLRPTRVGREKRIHMFARLVATVIIACCLTTAHAQAPQRGVIFENVRIFDGTSAALSAPSNVLVAGNIIETHFERARSPIRPG